MLAVRRLVARGLPPRPARMHGLRVAPTSNNTLAHGSTTTAVTSRLPLRTPMTTTTTFAAPFVTAAVRGRAPPGSSLAARWSRYCATSSSSSSSAKAAASETAVGRTAAERRQEMVAKGKSHLEKLKELWRQYGIVAVGTYFSMYGVVLGSIYVAIEQGWVSTARTSRGGVQPGQAEPPANPDFNLVTATNKVVSLAEDLGIAKYLDLQRVNSKTGTFVIAWVATKFTEPLRLALTLAITPRIARLVGRAPKKVLKV